MIEVPYSSRALISAVIMYLCTGEKMIIRGFNKYLKYEPHSLHR